MDLSWLDFLLLALFCWRAAHLITSESGPFNLAARFRTRFPLGGLTTCLKCASVWTARRYGVVNARRQPWQM